MAGGGRARPRGAALVVAVMAVAALVGPAAGAGGAAPTWPDAHEAVDGLGPTVNIGNALEAPTEGAWGVTITDDLLDAVVTAGFTAIRLPVRFSAHADAAPPYTLDPAFLDRVDEVLDGALARDLTVIVDLHHYDELFGDLPAHRDRFLALWDQLAVHLADRPPTVWFELLNEPRNDVSDDAWNDLAAEAIARIRTTNPWRTVVVGADLYSAVGELADLDLPDDPHVVATIHHYQPFTFTHQGASWVPGADAWLGTRWTATPTAVDRIDRAMATAEDWSDRTGVPVLLGEFGAYSTAPEADREAWADCVARRAEAHGLAWAWWEMAAGFGVWDPATGAFRTGLLRAIVDGDPDGPCAEPAPPATTTTSATDGTATTSATSTTSASARATTIATGAPAAIPVTAAPRLTA